MTSPAAGPEFSAIPDFHPTHVVPREGLPAWETPDASRPTMPLDAFLPVQLLSRRGAWGEIQCANGWTAWVDGRLLVTVPQPPPTGGRPLERAEDVRPLIARAADALDRYRRAAEEHTAGRTDADTFRLSTRGLRAGIVVDGEQVWLYDESSGRWMYGDGTTLATYAVRGAPDRAGSAGASAGAPGGAAAAGAPAPTAVASGAPAPSAPSAPSDASADGPATRFDGRQPGTAPPGGPAPEPPDHEPTRIDVPRPPDGGR
ncbi:hypothetical protein [Streptomyces sp. NPDC089799]|uniref:hypothetical protein n=1 Tax=Streptomyces sp. NPDC089799 TaxID=3155066 RepID=UPI0034336F90